MKEIQGKSTLVRVSAKFELVRGSSYRESTVFPILSDGYVRKIKLKIKRFAV